MKRKKCASDISPEKFAEMRPLLCSARRRRQSATVDLEGVVCSVVRTACGGEGCAAGSRLWVEEPSQKWTSQAARATERLPEKVRDLQIKTG